MAESLQPLNAGGGQDRPLPAASAFPPAPSGGALWPAMIAAGLVLFLTLGSLGAVALRAEGATALGPADWAAIRFTLWQAAVSALISVGLGVLVARALARRRFLGRGLLIALMGAPFILPVIVAVLGLIAVFGRSGILSQLLGWMGAGPLDIYGYQGVILAHVFFNLPLATRLILQGWIDIPAERFRLAASLNFTGRDVMRHLEWPMLRAVAPGAFMVIFIICTTSFAVALALGGGPRATTVELAIYQAFRFDFDLSKAALLAAIQAAIGGGAALFALGLARPPGFGGGLDRGVRRWDGQGRLSRLADSAVLLSATLFLLVPLGMVILDGLPRLASLPPAVLTAALRSVLVALGSVALALGLALPIAVGVARSGNTPAARAMEATVYLTVAVSPLVIGTGLFILVLPWANPAALALPVTALVNAAMSLPFILRAIVPAAIAVEADFGRLADTLGLKGLARLRLLLLPRLRRPLGFAAGLTAALSMGDLGVVALFAAGDGATLPLALYRLMGAYRMEDAAAAAVLLLGLSLALFWLFDRGGRIGAEP